MDIRKAVAADIEQIADIYKKILVLEAQGLAATGWLPNIYPTKATAQAALKREDLFVCEQDGKILASAIINKIQVDVYADCPWQFEADDEKVLVLHTLAVDPDAFGKKIGPLFVDFYEKTAAELNCEVLRMDTNATNLKARKLYKKLGYREAGIAPCVFNGIPDVQLVLIEKKCR